MSVSGALEGEEEFSAEDEALDELTVPSMAGFTAETMARLCYEANRTFLFSHGYFDSAWEEIESGRQRFMVGSVWIAMSDPTITPEALHQAQLQTLEDLGFQWGMRTSWPDGIIDFMTPWESLTPSLRFQVETIVAMAAVVRRLGVEVQEA